MPPNQMSEKDARYLRSQMKDFKKAYTSGNYGRANKIAMQVSQYFGFGDHETPIEGALQDDMGDY